MVREACWWVTVVAWAALSLAACSRGVGEANALRGGGEAPSAPGAPEAPPGEQPGSGAPAAIQFESAQPERVALRNSGGDTTAVIRFLVVNAAGTPAADGTVVDFEFFGTGRGAQIDPLEDATEAGFVETILTSGTVPGPVQIRATVRDSDPPIFDVSSPVAIGTGGAIVSRNFTLAVDTVLLDVCDDNGGLRTNVADSVSVCGGDRFDNPVPGVAVSFFVERDGGLIEPSAVTDEGGCATASYATQVNPRDAATFVSVPADGRVSVYAVGRGEEDFVDQNSNGLHDQGEPFDDLPDEAFIEGNENENGLFEPDLGEFLAVDENRNNQFDPSLNGLWDDVNGLLVDEGLIVLRNCTVALAELTTSQFLVPDGGTATVRAAVADWVFSGRLVELEEVKVEGPIEIVGEPALSAVEGYEASLVAEVEVADLLPGTTGGALGENTLDVASVTFEFVTRDPVGLFEVDRRTITVTGQVD